MSKVGPAVNGDLSDGMVPSMDARAMRSRDFVKDEWNDKIAKVFSCDVDHMYASVNDAKDREIMKLKKVVLVNLDFIQHQSEAIHARDKEIASLREERDTLRLRVQRMERRVTLQRHKDDPATGPAVATPEVAVPTPGLHDNASPEPTATIIKRRRVSGGSASRRKIRTLSGGSERKRSRSYSESNAERRMRSRPPLTTDKEYYAAAGNHDAWKPPDLHVVPDSLDKVEEHVQVPSWREKIYSPLYVIEGTENLEDEVFLKRHQKHEGDERRRKRWDSQRIREQTQLERLKQRIEKRRMPPRSPDRIVSSFYPTLEDVQEIALTPCLPVVAFGLPLRSFDQVEFNLGWSAPNGSKYPNLRHR